MSDIPGYGNAQNPGDPAVWKRMVDECSAGASLGIFLDPNMPGETFATFEPTEELGWIVCVNPSKALWWIEHFPNVHQVWMFTETPDELIARIAEEHPEVTVRKGDRP